MVLTEKRSLKNIWLTLSAFFLLCMSAYVVMPMIPVYIKSTYNASMTEITWITVGASIFGVIPAAIIGGRLSDFLGHKVTISAALLIFGVSKFLFPFASSLLLLFLLRAVGGLYAAAFPATQSVLAAEARTPDERTKFMSFYVLSFGAGLALGPILGGFVGQRWGFPEIFDTTTYLSLLGIVVIFFVDEQKKEVKKSKLLVISKSPAFWLASFSAFLCMGTIGTLLAVVPILELNELNFSASRIGLSMALLTGSFALFQFFIGRKLKEELLGSAILGGFVISIAGLIVLYLFMNELPFLLVALLLVGTGIGIAYVAATSMAAGTTTPENRGGIMGLFTASMNMGYGLLSVAVVSCASLLVVKTAFLILALLLSAGCLTLYLGKRVAQLKTMQRPLIERD